MALSKLQREKAETAMDSFIARRRPPVNLHEKVDLTYRLSDSEVVIFELRPRWNEPKEIIEENIARAKYVKARDIWKIYWQRADLKWHPYPPKDEVNDISDFIAEVDADPNGCFWG
jgi:Protein of unknown function (DUF3024)